jgi:hypothetical protein
MTIKQLISDKVALMDANNESYSFLHSEKDWQNLNGDEAILPAVYLDMPIKYRTKTSVTGYKEKTYILMLLFLFKSELDDEPSQQEQTFLKAENAQQQFEIILDNDADNISTWTSGECMQVLNLFDCNMSGVLMPLEITLRNNDSVCL